MARRHYRVICPKCDRTIMLSKPSTTEVREIRYQECRLCKPSKKWNHMNAPIVTEKKKLWS